MSVLKIISQMDVSPTLARMVEHAPLTQTLETSPAHAHQGILALVVRSLVRHFQEHTFCNLSQQKWNFLFFIPKSINFSDGCLSNPCRNCGTCSIDPETGSYSCACHFLFDGTQCESGMLFPRVKKTLLVIVNQKSVLSTKFDLTDYFKHNSGRGREIFIWLSHPNFSHFYFRYESCHFRYKRKRGCGAACMSNTWTALGGWDGPEVAVYRSFDTMDCMRLVEGTQESDSHVLVPGKVRYSPLGVATFANDVDILLLHYGILLIYLIYKAF